MPWHIVQLGARAELASPRSRRARGASAAAAATRSSTTTCTCLLNRGVLLTPFHNMTLMCPATTEADVARHKEVFAEALGVLTG